MFQVIVLNNLDKANGKCVICTIEENLKKVKLSVNLKFWNRINIWRKFYIQPN